MQRYFAHFASARRRLPHPLPIAQLGYVAAKSEPIDWLFRDLVFLVILSGRGSLAVDGGPEIAVRAPAVICAVPAHTYRYAPARTWEELYLKYAAESTRVAERMGLVVTGRHIWPIADLGSVRHELDEITRVMEQPHADGQADRMDRIAERLISETLLRRDSVPDDAAHRRILAAKAWLESHCREHLDFGRVARRFGFADSTFRRAWARYEPESPSRFVLGARMRHACRMLCETDESIANIADALGYADIYGFSRAFHAHVGETARDYRKRFSAERRDTDSVKPMLRRPRR